MPSSGRTRTEFTYHNHGNAKNRFRTVLAKSHARSVPLCRLMSIAVSFRSRVPWPPTPSSCSPSKIEFSSADDNDGCSHQLVGVDVGNWCVLWILPQFLILIPDVEIRRQYALRRRSGMTAKIRCFPVQRFRSTLSRRTGDLRLFVASRGQKARWPSLGLEYRQRSIPLKACFRYFRSVPQPLLAQVLI